MAVGVYCDTLNGSDLNYARNKKKNEEKKTGKRVTPKANYRPTKETINSLHILYLQALPCMGKWDRFLLQARVHAPLMKYDLHSVLIILHPLFFFFFF